MIREIRCRTCFEKTLRILADQDRREGWRGRVREIKVKKPLFHAITLKVGEDSEKMETKNVIELSSIMCDHCGEPIADGEQAFAITLWRVQREDEPAGEWEKEFSQNIPFVE
jgi:hypothetical protein